MPTISADTEEYDMMPAPMSPGGPGGYGPQPRIAYDYAPEGARFDILFSYLLMFGLLVFVNI